MHYSHFDDERREYLIERPDTPCPGSTATGVMRAGGQRWMDNKPRALHLSAHRQIGSKGIDTSVIRDLDDRGINT